MSVRCVKEVFNNDDIVDPNSELTKDEVNEKIMNVQEKGMVDKETFIADMMSFFPNYNAESNKTKLGKLFVFFSENHLGCVATVCEVA